MAGTAGNSQGPGPWLSGSAANSEPSVGCGGYNAYGCAYSNPGTQLPRPPPSSRPTHGLPRHSIGPALGTADADGLSKQNAIYPSGKET